jgi:hypothetical protein
MYVVQMPGEKREKGKILLALSGKIFYSLEHKERRERCPEKASPASAQP